MQNKTYETQANICKLPFKPCEPKAKQKGELA